MATESDGFVYGSELLENEFAIETEIERAADTYLAEGQFGERAPKIYAELGTALSLLLQAASCQWGCRGGDHMPENLLKRLANYSFAALRLARLGLYNESLTMLRSVAELANLIELFVVDKAQLCAWLATPRNERWREFKPDAVNRKVVATGNRPIVDRQTYSKLCDVGPHVSPESAKLSHQHNGTVHVGGEFSAFAFLLVLNELAIMLGACLKLGGHLIQAPSDRIQFLTEAGEKLEQSATAWLRVTNYEERLEDVCPTDG